MRAFRDWLFSEMDETIAQWAALTPKRLEPPNVEGEVSRLPLSRLRRRTWWLQSSELSSCRQIAVVITFQVSSSLKRTGIIARTSTALSALLLIAERR